MLDFNKLYTCPYCGTSDKLSDFMLHKKSGEYNMKWALCPLCNEKMKLKTLLADMSPFEWGEWLYLSIRVYNSPSFRMYDKVHWDILWSNVDLYGMAIKMDFTRGFRFHKGKQQSNDFMKNRLSEINLKYGIETKIKIKTKLDGWTK